MKYAVLTFILLLTTVAPINATPPVVRRGFNENDVASRSDGHDQMYSRENHDGSSAFSFVARGGSYSSDIKKEACKLIAAGHSQAEVASRLAISRATLQAWIAKCR